MTTINKELTKLTELKTQKEIKKEQKWEDGYLNKIIVAKDIDSITKYILKTVGKSKRSIKPFTFYKFLSKLFEHCPKIVKDLIISIEDWGCWKECFVLLLASKNSDLNNFIYCFVTRQLQEDFNKYSNDKTKKVKISMLAKWIPRQQSSFDKKIGVVTEMCKRLYFSSSSNLNNSTINRYNRKRYRKLISTLNKHLDTTEIKLCSKDYDNIDFSKVPAMCIKRNINTFLKHDICKNNLEKHLFEKYLDLDIKQFFSKLIFEELKDYEKNILNDVWNMNKTTFTEEIKKETGININICDVVIDLSKSMYDTRLICYSVAAAVLNSESTSTSKIIPNVIINANDPFIMDFSECKDIFEKTKAIVQECCNFSNINFEKIVEKNLVKKKNVLVITNKKLEETNESLSKKHYNKDKRNIIYWCIENKPKLTNKDIIVANNKTHIKKIIKNSSPKSHIFIFQEVCLILTLMLVGLVYIRNF
jgi:hypothetical protein